MRSCWLPSAMKNCFAISNRNSEPILCQLIYRIGSDEKTAEDEVTTQTNLLEQLKNQRDALSGVNLDEEAINIIKYQKAYQASANSRTVWMP